MIAAQSNRHHVGTAVARIGRLVDNESFLSTSNSQNARLRWVDDSSEIAHPKHAQVGDGKRATLQ